MEYYYSMDNELHKSNIKENSMSEFTLTEEMKKDRLNCGENTDCNECSCQIGTDDCIYNHIETVYQHIKKMDTNKLAIYLHSLQCMNYTVDEIKNLLNSEIGESN